MGDDKNQTTKKDPWDYKTDPTEPGWFPVVLCWDSEEGYWPGTAQWSSSKEWLSDDPIIGHGPRFETHEEAENWIYDDGHDDWL